MVNIVTSTPETIEDQKCWVDFFYSKKELEEIQDFCCYPLDVKKKKMINFC
jgi:hypothetical protein